MLFLRTQLRTAMGDLRGVTAAGRLCVACVELLDIDAAAVSLVLDGVTVGTLGASIKAARRFDEDEFTYGEGPCLEGVGLGAPVIVADLADTAEKRWPASGPAMLAHQIRGVSAIPITAAGMYVGAPDVFHFAHRRS